jgi:signal transduction histidine kinase
MERLLTGGPELATGEETMRVASRSLLHTPTAAERAPSPRSAPWARLENLAPVAYYLLAAAVLAATGYTAWRTGVLVLAAAAAWQARSSACRKARLRYCVNADADHIAKFAARSQSALFVTTGLTIAVTGGVRSPLLVTFISAYFAAIATTGDRRETRLLLGATALGVGALALLPRAWTGPELGGPAYTALVALSVLGVGALLAPFRAGLRKKRDELARARQEMASDALTRAQTLEQIGSKVAHELKNPLTGVKALVQLGLRNPAEAASRERLEVVEREVTRMQEILQNYLSFTRPLQRVTPTRVDLAPLVSETLVVLSARADDARVRLYAQGDATLEADPRRLKEALLNLVANAIEATPPGGEVVVEVRPAGDATEIVVRDTGRGMPAETLRRIGTPFFTTRDDGTGLGVVLARSVIAQHGGALSYESEPGNGTRVRVTLPSVAARVGDGACPARG